MALKIPDNLTQQVYHHIRDEIVRGKLEGQHLTENYFAERFRISKSPVREALNRLESEGLISIIPRRGAFVVELSEHDLEEIFELREALEVLAVKNAVLTDKILGRMRSAVTSAVLFQKKNDKINYIRADTTFHTTLAEASVNSRLIRTLENMRNQMLIVRSKTFELSSQSSVQEHREILDALEQNKRDVAADLMAHHIRAVRGRLLDYVRQRDSGPPIEESISADNN